MKKYSYLIVIIFLMFLIVFYVLKPKNYNITYKVNNALVKEIYKKDNEKYYITIKTKKNTFKYIYQDKYNIKKKVVKNIKVFNHNKSNCIKVKSDRFNFYPLCKKNNKYLAYKNKLNDKIINKKDNINIFDYNNQKFLLWNYYYFIYLNKNEFKKIKISNRDIYNLKNPYQNNKYLFLPKQDDDFKYNKAYIINSETGKKKSIKFNVDLYFDSYYLGYLKNDIFLFDIKNRQEYKIDLKNETIDKIKNQTYNNGKWLDVSINKMLSKKVSFISDKIVKYYINDNNLYANINNNYDILIDKKVNNIVFQNNNKVYYLIGDTLYYYNLSGTYKKLLQYSEWQFNYNDMIYIFD